MRAAQHQDLKKAGEKLDMYGLEPRSCMYLLHSFLRWVRFCDDTHSVLVPRLSGVYLVFLSKGLKVCFVCFVCMYVL